MGRASQAIKDCELVAYPSGARGQWPAAVMLYATAIVQAAVFVALPSSSDFFRARGLAETAYGAIFLPMLGVATVSSLAGPRMAGWLGLRAFYRIGLLCDIAMLGALAAAPMAPSLLPWILGAGAFLLGIALGWMGIALNATAVSLFPGSRGAALSALHAAVGLGATLTPMLVRTACASGRWPWFSLALATICVLLLALESMRWSIPFSGVVPVSGVTTGAAGAEAAPGVARRATDLRVAAGAFLYGVAEATIANWAILFLTAKGLSGHEASRALATFWLAVTAGRVGAVSLLRVAPPARVAAGLLVVLSVSFLGIGAVQTHAHALLAYGLAGLGASALFPIVLAIATLDSRGSVARTTAVVTAGLMIGLGCGAFLVGPLSRVAPMETVFRASAVWPALLLGWLWLGRRGWSTRPELQPS